MTTQNSSRYEVKFKDTNEWQPVAAKDMRRNLAKTYMNVDAMVAMIDEGHEVGTNFAIYRIAPPVESCAECGLYAPNHAKNCGSQGMEADEDKTLVKVHIKVRPKDSKRFKFLTSNGGLNNLRIHASLFTPERAETVMSEIRAEHGDAYELKTEAAYK